MASSDQRLLLLLIVLGFLSIAIEARPGLHFHPCNTLLVYSASIKSQNPNPNTISLEFFTISTTFDPKPFRPAFMITDEFQPHIRRPVLISQHRSSSSSSSSLSSIASSFRACTRDIVSVVVALLFGVGCGFLTAATMYLAWSLFSNHFYDFHNSNDDSDGDEDDSDATPKKMGYVKIPSVDIAVAPTSAPAKAVK